MGPITWLLFTGGEPTLREDLPKIASVYYRTNGCRRLTVPTNGLLPERTAQIASEILRNCPKAYLTVSLALDDLYERADSIRGVKGSFEAFLRTYRELAKMKIDEKRLSLNLNTVLMNRNINHIEEIMDFVLKEMPAVDFHGFEILRGSSPDGSLAPPTSQEYESLLGKLESYWEKFPFYRTPLKSLLKAMKVETRVMELEVMKGDARIPCHAGAISGLIDAVGDVYFCEELNETVGNLREAEYDFRKVWFSEMAERLREFVNRGGCQCTHSCFLASSIMFEPRFYPRLLKRVFLSKRS
jgi:MoaA/NifB/PqqE/SkfB family radical SAM enzyme